MSAPRPGAARRPVVVRHALPAPPERVFRLFTDGADLQRWFCDAIDAEPREGGLIHAAWQDDDGGPWDRMGRFAVFEPPRRVVIEWQAIDAPGDPADPAQPASLKDAGTPDRLQVAIVGDGAGGSTVTVVAPLPVADAAVRDEVRMEAAQAGWAQTFEALAALLAADVNR